MFARHCNRPSGRQYFGQIRRNPTVHLQHRHRSDLDCKLPSDFDFEHGRRDRGGPFHFHVRGCEEGSENQRENGQCNHSHSFFSVSLAMLILCRASLLLVMTLHNTIRPRFEYDWLAGIYQICTLVPNEASPFRLH